jgi:glucose-1-phosphatase
MKTAKILTVIWDMGGVLLRTEDPVPRTRLAEKMGLTRRALEKLVFASETSRLAEAGKIPEEKHHQYVTDKLGIPFDQWSDFILEFFLGDRINDDLLKYMGSLKPNYRLGLLSNAWLSARDFVTDHYQLLDVFDQTIFSAEVSMRKPEPDIYLLALAEMDTASSQAVFIDDVVENVEAARAVGMRAVQYRTTQQVIQDLSSILV